MVVKSIVALLEYYGIQNMCSSYTSWLQLHIDDNYITDEGGKKFTVAFEEYCGTHNLYDSTVLYHENKS
jgi:hypothetical protein